MDANSQMPQISKDPDVEKIKSTAIVKYSVSKPAQFNKLQCNTDLNLPPSNWLSSSADSYGLQQVLSQQKGFSSFRMAQMFPDCVGEVDVVSDAENIKKLLKIPYHKGHISMMVHRVENTLLLDDFDIYKHLLKTAESEWQWLRKFFFEHINHETCEEDRNVYIKNRTREALKQKSLVSKFLYHSLLENDTENCDASIQNNNLPLPVQGQALPEPSPLTEAPDAKLFDHKYNRNVIWTFEDIEMLLGTDMPIFGGGKYPCISLRLRDMNKPINVLTGIDYWLDNLMSNVPEVIMCYHLKGIVQKYELIKTEDLPRLDDSKFSPKVIRDVAQSILSFLKSNATKAGHTYWLFKGKDEEVVKLYDLTSLCSKQDFEGAQNPFTIPVAMLLYRVARNMIHSSERYQPGTIRMLLDNCVNLLPEEKYPEIVTSSHFMLSELFVPFDTNPESPNFDQIEENDNESVYDDDLEEELDVPVTYLDLETNIGSRKSNNSKRPLAISGSTEERCLQALHHVSVGLKCLKYFPNEPKQDKEDDVPMAKPFEPIPMPYSKMDPDIQKQDAGQVSNKKNEKKHKKKKKAENVEMNLNENALLIKEKNEAQHLPTWKEKHTKCNNISWKDHLKRLLYGKAILVYATLAEYHFVSTNYGSSLRCIALLARCREVIRELKWPSSPLRESCLLGRAGDCCVTIAQNWINVDVFKAQLQNHSLEDFQILEQIENDERLYDVQLGSSSIKCVFLYDILTKEQMLLKSVECYEEALKSSGTENMLRRLGNGLNETGMFYLKKAKMCKEKETIIEIAGQAKSYLVRGLEVFEKIKDDNNVALLYANMGHLHRLLAFVYSSCDSTELTLQEKMHSNKAMANYKKALQVLGERKYNSGIWDTVHWELSTTLFNVGTAMHEYPPSNLTKTEAEKEVIEILQKALHYCDLDESNPKFPLYQYRAAILHYRIASLYHKHIWSTVDDSSNRKNIIHLARINYEKASRLYFATNDVINYFTAQMQRFALCEYLCETASVPNMKIKHLQECLNIVLECNEMTNLLKEKKVELPNERDETSDSSNKANFKTINSLLNLVKQKLQHILKYLIKLCTNKPPPNKDCLKLGDIYKKCYKLTFELKDGLEYYNLVYKLDDVLNKIKELYVT